MNYIGLSAYDTANGPGVRVSLFVSGCTLRCKGCFNKESWSFTAGRPFTAETEAQIMKALDSKWIAGFSLLGGDPFEPSTKRFWPGFCSASRNGSQRKPSGRGPEGPLSTWKRAGFCPTLIGSLTALMCKSFTSRSRAPGAGAPTSGLFRSIKDVLTRAHRLRLKPRRLKLNTD